MTELCAVRNDIEGVFKVETKKRGTVFISIECTPGLKSVMRVVIVEAKKLLELWKNEPCGFNKEYSNGSPSAWKKFKRYEAAEKGFSFGFENPVPLAMVVYRKHKIREKKYRRKWIFKKKLLSVETKEIGYVEIDGGRHRTIWLLANDVESFPVQVNTNESELLYEAAGMPGTKIWDYDQILNSDTQ